VKTLRSFGVWLQLHIHAQERAQGRTNPVCVTTLESTTERLEDALRRLAVEAADLFEELLASGAELPYDLEPTDDGPLPMYSYSPLTGQFIERHLAELRRLEAFVEVREIAGEETAIGFMVGLWEGKTEFDVAGDRLRGAVDGVLATISTDSDEATPAGEVIVPLVGFHMPKDEIELDGVRIVRADLVPDAPGDAVDATRSGGRGKPGFLASLTCGLASVAPAAVVADDLRRALRTMRLFRPGAVGLAAHGWAKRSGGWERFGTGVSRPRQGGYRLTGNETAALENFSRTLAERGARMPALEWAASRFELGAERASMIEALSDYLLALRGLLEGGGPARTSLSARVAALACEPHEREQGRVCVERALAIERKLMSGGRYRPVAGASPLDVIAEIEELLRRLLKGLATGELSGDLRAAADEVLLAGGLSASHIDTPGLDETAEWRLPDPAPDEELDLSAISDGHLGEAEVEVSRASGDDATVGDGEVSETNEIGGLSVRRGEEDRQTTTRIVVDDVELPDLMAPESEHRASPGSDRKDWFSAPDGEVDWPAFARPRRRREREEEREPSKDRVRYLFPVPDATDWSVGELTYESKRSR
jgi:hypothetical protein